MIGGPVRELLTDVQYRVRGAHPLRPGMRSALRRAERADPRELRRMQERRLRLLVRWAAARTPYYRRWFADAGLDPRDVRTLDDLAALPTIGRDNVAADPTAFLAYPRRLAWPARSSGTSGTVVTVYRSPGSAVYERCALERQWSWFGVPPRAPRVVLRGSTVAGPHGITRIRPATGELLVSSFHLTAEHLPEILAAVRAHAPVAVEGWPSSLTLFATLLRDAGEPLRVRAVITSSEVIGAAAARTLEEVFGGPVVDHYGQTERVALAGNCPCGGLHAFGDYGIVETLPVPDAPQRREIVGTPLHNWAFPLLRYRTGDEVVGEPDPAPCPCGRSFPLLGAVDGRVEDAFTAADGRPIPLPHTLVKNLTGLREVQVAQHAPGRFEVRVVPGHGYDREAVAAAVRATVHRVVGPGQTVEVRETERIPRSASGKLRPAIVLGE
ncbi:phenylacetate--CoA ligase family protein [Actinomycetospora termitidis]|uniref:Phenylacetate--CoA ligase family protein n=1 Tax=Actinomycetospora termitidis TaxID=3053470 RepID=A0ABT7MEC6_9PSEU|nr:hypothetical protein [Actinomycetospora sp. Odt1-22]MDL5159004.1 hypothetical protein [Actinomycetospora sp. Odt1-22]